MKFYNNQTRFFSPITMKITKLIFEIELSFLVNNYQLLFVLYENSRFKMRKTYTTKTIKDFYVDENLPTNTIMMKNNYYEIKFNDINDVAFNKNDINITLYCEEV